MFKIPAKVNRTIGLSPKLNRKGAIIGAKRPIAKPRLVPDPRTVEGYSSIA